MSKINNKSIVYGLGILAVLALGMAITPIKADAQTTNYNNGYYDDGYDHFLAKSENPIPNVYSISPNFANVGDGPVDVTISGRGFTSNSVGRWNGSNRSTTFIDSSHLLIHLNAGDMEGSNGRYINVFNPTRDAYSNAVLFKINGYVASGSGTVAGASTDSSYNPFRSTSSDTSGESINTDSENSEESSLVGSAIFGSSGVMPSGLLQWILLAIVILLIVILVRKITGASDRYHNEPLKHA